MLGKDFSRNLIFFFFFFFFFEKICLTFCMKCHSYFLGKINTGWFVIWWIYPENAKYMYLTCTLSYVELTGILMEKLSSFCCHIIASLYPVFLCPCHALWWVGACFGVLQMCIHNVHINAFLQVNDVLTGIFLLKGCDIFVLSIHLFFFSWKIFVYLDIFLC